MTTEPHAAYHRTIDELATHLEHLRAAPREIGTLDLIVRRPAVGEREVQEIGELSVAEGLVGDSWNQRSSRRTPDGSPHPDMQLNVMGSRIVTLVAGLPERRPLAGDQLYLDLDLSPENLPAGTRLAIGTAVIEVTDQPHTGCAKFLERFGEEALRFVNGSQGRPLRLRGLNARVVVAGTIHAGAVVTKV